MTDIIYPSDNEYGIPVLKSQSHFSLGVEQPVIVWGSKSRSIKQAGTICFYTDDYRFNGVWNDPTTALLPGAGAYVEPNFSVFDSSPLATVIWQTYRKRWLARFLQEAGCTVFVDLCVPDHFAHVNLLGVPRGWQHYATAAWDARIADLELEYSVAKRHSAGYDFTLLVYGGGKMVTQWCAESQAKGYPVVRAGHRSDARKRPGEWTRKKQKELDAGNVND